MAINDTPEQRREYDFAYYTKKKQEFIAKTGIKNDHLPLVTATKWGEVYDGYAIHSVTGTVYSFKGSWKSKNQYGWYPMKPYIDKDGYAKIKIQKNKKPVSVSVHSLVMHTINGPPGRDKNIPEKTWKRLSSYIKSRLTLSYEINHIDHDKTNFSPSNLEWVYREENRQKYKEHLAKFGKVA